ncbi:MAG: nickel-dependent lactate racemase [Rectinemataceae bacterium]
MTYPMQYGERSIGVEFPDDRVDIISAPPAAAADEMSLIMGAIRDASLPLEDFLGQCASVAVVVSDHTRNTGSRLYMPILMDLVRKPGRKVTIVIALGLHRPATGNEIVRILGFEPGENVTVLNHDPDSYLADCGEGAFCRAAVEAEKVIVTGSVTFHPMAGYSGGWKSILPGIASRESVLKNHGLYFSGECMDPGIGPARLEGNPISADIRRRTWGFAGKTWCLNVVQDETKAIVYAAAGSVDDAWRVCADYLARHNSPGIARLYPVVVASSGGYPSDFSFYQSMKTLTNASRACVDGGSIYLLMECGNGWELDRQVLSLADLELTQIASRVKENFTMSGLAAYMALSLIRTHKVFLLSSLPEREVRGFGMRYLSSGAEIGALVAAEGADRIAVIPAAAAVLPSLDRL